MLVVIVMRNRMRMYVAAMILLITFTFGFLIGINVGRYSSFTYEVKYTEVEKEDVTGTASVNQIYKYEMW
jgi:hypothetical protein